MPTISPWLMACVVVLLGWGSLSAQHDVSVSMSMSPDSVRPGDVVTMTVYLENEGGTTVSGLVVTAPVPSGLQLSGHTASAGTYDTGTGLWSVPTWSGTLDSLVLTMTVNAGVEGLIYGTAELTAMNETDDDSTPGNGDYLEDDIATACTSAPIEICTLANDTVRLEAPAGLTNYQWYNGPTLVGTGAVFYATEPGRYTYTADSLVSGCGTGSCCPIIIEGKCFDLALYKKRAPWQAATADAGDTVTFRITVVNQGDYYADSILIRDYIPEEAILSDADWTAAGFDATILLTAGDQLDAGGLAPGDSVNVDITLQLTAPLAANLEVENNAEIASARTADGRTFDDWDSTPDNVSGNDIYLVDNYIDGNGKQNGDEDDHDPAFITVK
ncbi:MAG: DUF11 domain-containing protein, partial [Bacteroidetes bacterium]